MNIRAFICGCGGPSLTAAEEVFFAKMRPWGLILFHRNIESPSQLESLIARFRAVQGCPHAPIFIDQEGGDVQRLGPPFWMCYPAAQDFVEKLPASIVREAVKMSARLMAYELQEVGIEINCAPVLDVATAQNRSVLGRRTYGSDPKIVTTLAQAYAEGLLSGGILPVLKHIPGYGRAECDSHYSLPTVWANIATLESTDFVPFRALNYLPLAMVTHTVYRALDPEEPATFSPLVFNYLRRSLSYAGLLLSDALEMGALNGSLRERAQKFFQAGGDIALICSGNLGDSEEVAYASPSLAGITETRTQFALNYPRTQPKTFFDLKGTWQALRNHFPDSDFFLPQPF